MQPQTQPPHNVQPIAHETASGERWFEVAWTQVSTFKKLMMHLKEHCSYVTVAVSLQDGLTFTGVSAIDHLCLSVNLPPPCFSLLCVHWPATKERIELNMYTLYSIMKKSTAFRHERVRLRVEWIPAGYYAVTVTFETVNKSERFHMRASALIHTPPLPPDPRSSRDVPSVHAPLTAKVHTVLLTDSFKRFDEESFRTVAMTVHTCGEHPCTVSLEPVFDTLTLRARNDSMKGTVYIPYLASSDETMDSTSSRRPHRLGDYLLASLRSVTRFASLSSTKYVTLRSVWELSRTSVRGVPLSIQFDVCEHGRVACYLPSVCVDREASSSSEEEWPQ